MREQYIAKRKLLTDFAAAFDMMDVMAPSRFTALIEAKKGEVKITRTKPVRGRCPDCKGTGKFSIRRPNPDYDRTGKSVAPKEIIDHFPCKFCGGEKQFTLASQGFMAEVTPELREELRQIVKVETRPFFGLQLGMEQSGVMEISFYQFKSNMIGQYKDGFSEFFIYKGNSRETLAKATILEFMFGKLIGVQLVFEGHQAGRIDGYLVEDYTKWGAAAVDIDNELIVPRDRQGRPLISSRLVPLPDGKQVPAYLGYTLTYRLPVARGMEKLRPEDLSE